jgi:hypothetical protein
MLQDKLPAHDTMPDFPIGIGTGVSGASLPTTPDTVSEEQPLEPVNPQVSAATDTLHIRPYYESAFLDASWGSDKVSDIDDIGVSVSGGWGI